MVRRKQLNRRAKGRAGSTNWYTKYRKSSRLNQEIWNRQKTLQLGILACLSLINTSRASKNRKASSRERNSVRRCLGPLTNHQSTRWIKTSHPRHRPGNLPWNRLNKKQIFQGRIIKKSWVSYDFILQQRQKSKRKLLLQRYSQKMTNGGQSVCSLGLKSSKIHKPRRSIYRKTF